MMTRCYAEHGFQTTMSSAGQTNKRAASPCFVNAPDKPGCDCGDGREQRCECFHGSRFTLADGLSHQMYPPGRDVGPRINSTIEREEQRSADNAGVRQSAGWPTSAGSKAKYFRIAEGRSACFRLADHEQVED